MKSDGGAKSSAFSLTNLFSGDNGGQLASTLRGNRNLEPHPSVLPHISPLNRLGPDKQKETSSEPLPIHPLVRSGTLPNGLPYIILPNKSPPGRFEAHLQVFSGSGECCPYHILESLSVVYIWISYAPNILTLILVQLMNWNRSKESPI